MAVNNASKKEAPLLSRVEMGSISSNVPARIIAKKPKIMILDDSTSAVDTATDAQIRKGLKQLDKNMTTIIIAQRISSVEDCDKIVVLDDGKINAVGTHEQLLQSCSIYQEVYRSQQKGTAEGGEN